jgi:hypothetical protein
LEIQPISHLAYRAVDLKIGNTTSLGRWIKEVYIYIYVHTGWGIRPGCGSYFPSGDSLGLVI